MTDNTLDLVPFNVQATKDRWMQDPEFCSAYNALEHEFAALTKRLCPRQQADAKGAKRG